MPKRPNDNPTSIYWLIDVRPCVIAEGWTNGLPFYCGKTVHSPYRRLREHRYAAEGKGRCSRTMIAARLRLVGQFVRLQIVETVPPKGDWPNAERRWIEVLRAHFPDTVNAAIGGEGAPGVVRSPETREKIRRANVGKKVSKKTRQKIKLGAIHTPESRERMRQLMTGRKHTPETLEKMRQARRARDAKWQAELARLTDPSAHVAAGRRAAMYWARWHERREKASQPQEKSVTEC